MPQAPILSISRRTRATPFSQCVKQAGVGGYTVYNHMLLATFFDDVVKDYHHLKNHVQLWDVSCQRQITIKGRDATQLVQLLTPRSIKTMQVGQCYYLPLVDEKGGLLNDPMLLKLSTDSYWLSIADADILLWVKGLALGLKMQVSVFEAGVYPLAVQGPKSDDLVASVFQENLKALPFFRFTTVNFQGRPLRVSRSGYSGQGGFEFYLDDWQLAEPLWYELMRAGKPYEVKAGCPNLIERIEAGLLSYGNDMNQENTPYEAGLGRYCDTIALDDCLGGEALKKYQSSREKQTIRGLLIEGDAFEPCISPWPALVADKKVGQITSVAYSPDLHCGVAIAMLKEPFWQKGSVVSVQTPSGARTATVTSLPFK